MALNINEVAARLNLPVETVHRWIRQGKIPMQRSRGNYTIRAEMLERWADEHKLEIQDQSKTAQVPKADEPGFDGIVPAMQRGGVFYDVQGDDRESALQSAVALIPNLGSDERNRVYDALLERERMASTGIGNGIALPHPRSSPDLDLALPQITTCFLAQPVAFDAIDDQPVSVLMVLLSCSTKQHLAMLSKLSFHLRNRSFRDDLLNRPDRSEMFSNIAALESKSDIS